MGLTTIHNNVHYDDLNAADSALSRKVHTMIAVPHDSVPGNDDWICLRRSLRFDAVELAGRPTSRSSFYECRG